MFGKGNIPKWNICVCIVCFNVIFIWGSNVIFQLLRVHISSLCLWYWFFFHSDMGRWRLHKRHSRSRLWYCAGSGLGAGSVGLCAESFNRWVLCVSSSQNLQWEKKEQPPSQGSFSSSVEARENPGNEVEETADIWQRHHWLPREMASEEERAKKFHTDDVSLTRSG